MSDSFLLSILPQLVGAFILAIVIWKKQWVILLGISCLYAINGLIFQNLFLINNNFDVLDGFEQYFIISNFLKAIFFLLLAIFTWMLKEHQHR